MADDRSALEVWAEHARARAEAEDDERAALIDFLEQLGLVVDEAVPRPGGRWRVTLAPPETSPDAVVAADDERADEALDALPGADLRPPEASEERPMPATPEPTDRPGEGGGGADAVEPEAARGDGSSDDAEGEADAPSARDPDADPDTPGTDEDEPSDEGGLPPLALDEGDEGDGDDESDGGDAVGAADGASASTEPAPASTDGEQREEGAGDAVLPPLSGVDEDDDEDDGEDGGEGVPPEPADEAPLAAEEGDEDVFALPPLTMDEDWVTDAEDHPRPADRTDADPAPAGSAPGDAEVLAELPSLESVGFEDEEGDEGAEGEEGGVGLPDLDAGDPTDVDATPAARALADEHGLDLSSVAGSGQDGRILKGDVEALVPSAGAAAPDDEAGEEGGGTAGADGGDERLPLASGDGDDTLGEQWEADDRFRDLPDPDPDDPMSIEELAAFESDALRVDPPETRENEFLASSANPADVARRKAFTLASDVVAYRPDDYRAALADGLGALRETFADDIEEAWENFAAQVDPGDVPDREAIFVEAVNEIIGNKQPVLAEDGAPA